MHKSLANAPVSLRVALGTYNINNSARDENMHAYQHLNELMGFVLELQKSVDMYKGLLEFDLVSQRSVHALNEWYEFEKGVGIFASSVENARCV